MTRSTMEAELCSVVLCELTAGLKQGFSVFDRDLKLLMFNQTAQDLLRLPDDLVQPGTPMEKIYRFKSKRGDYGPGETEDHVADRLATARTFEPCDYEWERANQKVFRVKGMALDIGAYLTVYVDISLLKAHERELLDTQNGLERRLKERTQEVQWSRDLIFNGLNAISDGVVISDRDGNAIMGNDRINEIYPKALDIIEAGGKLIDVIRTVFPQQREKDLDELSQEVGVWSERQFPDGRWFKINRARTSDGGIISVYSDVSSYKKQQSTLQGHADELVRHLRQEKELRQMQREFVSMASHEFRTPLAIIDSNAQRMKRRVERLSAEDILDRVDKIRDSVERMQYLIDRFLDFSRTQSASGMTVSLEETDLHSLACSVWERQREISPSHTFHLDIEDLPGTAFVDRKLVEQCLSNLLSNAVKYSPESGVVTMSGMAEGDNFILRIKDNGVGIPKAELPKVFNRYFRASTSSGIAGTGIGLNMTAMIVEKHHGQIDIESDVGVGTTVTLSLPINKSQEAAGQGGRRRASRNLDAMDQAVFIPNFKAEAS